MKKAIQFISLFILMASFKAYSEVELEKRELQVKNFPCMKCHTNIVNEKASFPLQKPHQDMKFKHFDKVKNCFLCHDQKDRNSLKLVTGGTVSYDKSYMVCAQCHGEKARDWKLGIHGRQIGKWDGPKYRFACANCHNPHSPQFPRMKADPPPRHPHGKKAKQGGH
jgi:hypothetical protein